jgi:hypothetical protein
LEADDLTSAQKDAGPSQEPEGVTEKQDAPISASGPEDAAPKGATDVPSKKKRKPKAKDDQKIQPDAKQSGLEKKVEEPAAAIATVGGAPESQKVEEKAPETNEKLQVNEEPKPERVQMPISTAPEPEAEGVQEKHEEAVPEQKPEQPSGSQGLEESKWKFDEQNTATMPPAQGTSQSEGEALGAAAINEELYKQPEALSAEDKARLAALKEEEAKAEKEEEKRQRRKRMLIALLIVAIICILAFCLYYALSHGHSKSVSQTSNALKYNATITAQVRNVTAHAGAGSGQGGSAIIVSGTVSPPPKSTNSVVLVSIVNPSGTQVYSTYAPVSPSGVFNLSVMVGKTGNWSSGTYTTTSNYNGNLEKTTFYLTTGQVRNVTAHESSGSGQGNNTIIVSGTVSPPPKSTNSVVLISILNPSGTRVYSTDAPVSPSGSFNLSVMTGKTNWSSGTYTATSSYYGNNEQTTFYLAANPTSNSIEVIVLNELCSIYLTVHSVIFLLGIMLVVLGAVIYSFAHIMPGQSKNQMQTYGMGMVIGGVIGVLIGVLAPYILSLISNNALPIASCISKPII